jgi:hypothetical protein
MFKYPIYLDCDECGDNQFEIKMGKNQKLIYVCIHCDEEYDSVLIEQDLKQLCRMEEELAKVKELSSGKKTKTKDTAIN